MSSASSSNGEDELQHVLNEARDLGYLGPGPVAVHRAHSLAFGRACSPFLNSGALRVADLGSGGGLPGLELALAWPASRWVFLDVNQRRMATLEIALDRLRISGRATIALGRAEDLVRRPDLRGSFDLVVARGFAGPAVTAECAAPLLRVGGHLVVSDPPEDRARWSVGGLSELGLVGERQVHDGFAFFVACLVQPAPDRFPRRVGIPAKRPLF